MLPIALLMIEHRLIERMITLMDQHVKTVSQPELIDLSLIEKGIDFLRSYADRCHHGKEESILFSGLNSKTLNSDDQMIYDELTEEHNTVRAHVRSLIAASEQAQDGNVEMFADIVELVDKVTVLYMAHFEKEDKHFFIPAMNYFSLEEQEGMLRQFGEYDRQLIHEKYHNIVDSMELWVTAKISTNIIEPIATPVYECMVCEYQYDANIGDTRNDISAGTLFEGLPIEWVCPICGATKELFKIGQIG